MTQREQAVQDILDSLDRWGIAQLDNYWSNQLVAQVEGMKDRPIYDIYQFHRGLECMVKAVFGINPGQAKFVCDQQVAERLNGIPDALVG